LPFRADSSIRLDCGDVAQTDDLHAILSAQRASAILAQPQPSAFVFRAPDEKRFVGNRYP
jgi:hypothetical protein